MISQNEIHKEIVEMLNKLKMHHMASELEKIYLLPNFVGMNNLELLHSIVSEEYIHSTNARYISRLKKAGLTGSSCLLEQCVDSKERSYLLSGIIDILSTLNFIEQGMNLCIFGASDSGKTYLARALGTNACKDFRVGYFHCDNLVGNLAYFRKDDYKSYSKKINSLVKLDLVILDDFLLHPIANQDEIKALYEVLEKRNVASKSCIVCSQRDPKSWPSMLMQDEVESNSILKRATKHYSVMIERKLND